jgi:hypothetical protein
LPDDVNVLVIAPRDILTSRITGAASVRPISSAAPAVTVTVLEHAFWRHVPSLYHPYKQLYTFAVLFVQVPFT